MKFSITKGLIRDAVGKGGMAAMTSEANNEDQLATQPTLNCIKITANDNGLVFESSVQRISSRFTLPMVDGIKVESPGNVCIPANWFLKACLTPQDDSLTASVETFPIEGAVPPAEGEVPPTVNVLVRVVGEKNGKKYNTKWSTPSYSTDVFPEVSYEPGAAIMSCKASVLKDMLDKVHATPTTTLSCATMWPLPGMQAGSSWPPVTASVPP